MKQIHIAGYGTKYGPTDFYDHTYRALAEAFTSGEDFTTGWMGCKKEILSTEIEREGDRLEVRVSVSDDFDTEGMGTVVETIAKDLEAFFEQLERMGAKAHQDADDDRKTNEPYVGYSVGREGRWECTYLVSIAGFDAPPGDNYSWWGWQEVDDEGQRPDEIPEDVADQLENAMVAQVDTVTIGEWTAEKW